MGKTMACCGGRSCGSAVRIPSQVWSFPDRLYQWYARATGGPPFAVRKAGNTRLLRLVTSTVNFSKTPACSSSGALITVRVAEYGPPGTDSAVLRECAGVLVCLNLENNR